MTRRRPTSQLDLLDWEPPQPVIRFEERVVRAATVQARIAKAISASLAGLDREAVARGMTEFLGRPVSRAMIDAYASAAREDHTISVPRFMGLAHVTNDRRLVQLLADPLGLACIEGRYLPLIELAAVREREEQMRRRGEALRRQARSGGLL